jgi:hypothetical protein
VLLEVFVEHLDGESSVEIKIKIFLLLCRTELKKKHLFTYCSNLHRRIMATSNFTAIHSTLSNQKRSITVL